MKKFIIKNPIVNINWLREKTPITNNNTKIYCDSVEFEIDYNGINKLERNINNSNEFIKCYVHFLNGTNKCIGIYFSVVLGVIFTGYSEEIKIINGEKYVVYTNLRADKVMQKYQNFFFMDEEILDYREYENKSKK